jgi:hypothetical protein
LLVPDTGDIAHRLAGLIEQHGGKATLVQPSQIATALQEHRVDGVIYLAGIDTHAGRQQQLGGALELVQGLIRSETNPRLWLVTRGANRPVE